MRPFSRSYPTRLNHRAISLLYEEARRRDGNGNEFRYRAKVKLRDNPGDHWAYDVILATPETYRDKLQNQVASASGAPAGSATSATDRPGTIDGSKTPELIPTEVAYGIFLQLAACSADDDELHQKKCRLVQRAVGLDPYDSEQLPVQLANFKQEMSTFDGQIVELRRWPGTDPEIQRVFEQRKSAIKAKVDGLRQKLTPDGQRRLDAYVEKMKAKIKFVPQSRQQ